VKALDFLAERGKALGYNLTIGERELILKESNACNGKMTKGDWERLINKQFLQHQERLTLSDYVAKSHDRHLGQQMLKWTSRLGISFFAMTGAHTAGEAGMHAVGATIVGCVTSLGGGTFNQLVTGSRPVGWVKDPSFLAITCASALVGFYVWPFLERLTTDEEEAAAAAAAKEEERKKFEKKMDAENGGNDYKCRPSALRYSLETIALGSLAVVGAQQGIVGAYHPIVSCALGVSIAFGGVVRDLMCKRDLSLGASTGCQSYGIASLSGASVYVALRELHVWNCAGSTSKLVKGGIPIGLRILMGFATVFGVRAFGWNSMPDGLFLSMDDNADANVKLVKTSAKKP